MSGDRRSIVHARMGLTREGVSETIRKLFSEISGSGGIVTPDAEQIYEVVGEALLNLIKSEYLVKARGGTDSAGVTWPPLSKEYLAYQRRFGPGEKAALKKAAGLGRGHRHGIVEGQMGLLSAAQAKRWWQLYRQFLAIYGHKVGFAAAKSIAAKIAWAKLKAEGAKTILDVYGNRKVEIMRDTGALFNSLDHDHFLGGISVGSPVEYAAAAFSKRPAWPLDGSLPPAWSVVILDALQEGVSIVLERRLAL